MDVPVLAGNTITGPVNIFGLKPTGSGMIFLYMFALTKQTIHINNWVISSVVLI